MVKSIELMFFEDTINTQRKIKAFNLLLKYIKNLNKYTYDATIYYYMIGDARLMLNYKHILVYERQKSIQSIVMNRSDKQREMDELKKLHDSLDEGLPEVPTPLLEYAREKAKLEELRNEDPQNNEIPVLNYQANSLNSLANLMKYINQSHQTMVNNIYQLESLRKNLEVMAGEKEI